MLCGQSPVNYRHADFLLATQSRTERSEKLCLDASFLLITSDAVGIHWPLIADPTPTGSLPVSGSIPWALIKTNTSCHQQQGTFIIVSLYQTSSVLKNIIKKNNPSMSSGICGVRGVVVILTIEVWLRKVLQKDTLDRFNSSCQNSSLYCTVTVKCRWTWQLQMDEERTLLSYKERRSNLLEAGVHFLLCPDSL